MKLYIDKENLLSLTREAKRNRRDFNRCECAIIDGMAVHCNFPKRVLAEDEDMEQWVYTFGDCALKVSFADTAADSVPSRSDFRTNFYKDCPNHYFSAFLLDEPKADLVSQKNCIAIGNVGQEADLLLRLAHSDNEFMAKDITNWEDVLPQLPISDAVIVDEYYFSDETAYTSNDNALIKCLAAKLRQAPLHLVIITKEGVVDSRIDLAAEQEKIEKLVRKLTDSKSSTVAVYTSHKCHDRFVLTNYYRVKSGCGFQLKDKRLKNDVTVDIKCNARSQSEAVSKDLARLVKEIMNSPVKSYGSTDSNFLKI